MDVKPRAKPALPSRVVALRLVIAWLVLANAGCGLAPFASRLGSSDAALEKLAAEDSPPPRAASVANPPAEAAAPPVEDFPTELKHDGWAAAPVDTLHTEPAHRWRNVTVEKLTTAEIEPGVLPAALRSTDATVRTNAAILLAWQGDPAGSEALQAAAAGSMPLSMRCAAVEALASFPSSDTRAALERLIAAQDLAYARRAGSYLPTLHAETLRGLGRHVAPDKDERFTKALGHDSVEVRVAALGVWRDAKGALPTAAIDLAADRDPQVRAAAIRAVAAHNAPHAEELVDQALWDGNLHVRLAGVTALGDLPGPVAKARLVELSEADGELLRAAAIASLARQGDRELVAKAADDSSWRVRQAVAESLSAWPDAAGANLALRLAGNDTSAEVQKSLAAAVESWPLALAGPTLLAVMASNHLPAREQARAALAASWPPAKSFAVEAPKVRRDEMLAALRTQLPSAAVEAVSAAVFDEPVAAPGAPQESEVGAVVAALATLDDPRAGEAAHAAAQARLTEFGSRLPVLVDVAAARGTNVAEVVYREILPQCDPLFADLAALASLDQLQRRTAADSIRQTADRLRGSPLAKKRVLRVLAQEHDPLVWRALLVALENEASPEAALVAQMAIAHDDPEIRRRGCLYLAAHPDPRQIERLAELLTESDPALVRAALAAIGATRLLPADDAAFERLLRGEDRRLRVDTARCLALAGDPRGREAFVRLAHDSDEQVRLATAVAMGEIADPEFVPLLRELEAGRGATAKAARESLAKLGINEAPTVPASKWRAHSGGGLLPVPSHAR